MRRREGTGCVCRIPVVLKHGFAVSKELLTSSWFEKCLVDNHAGSYMYESGGGAFMVPVVLNVQMQLKKTENKTCASQFYFMLLVVYRKSR